jgi:hypothetical protein
MHVEILHQEAEIRASGTGKFVIFAVSSMVEPMAVVFGMELTHRDVLRECEAKYPELEFFGAGKFEASTVWWDSESCKASIGRDRPLDTEQADHLLRQMREFTKKLKQRI